MSFSYRHKRTHGSRDSRESDISSGGSQTSQTKPKVPGSNPGVIPTKDPNASHARKRKASVDSMPPASSALAVSVAADLKNGGHVKCPICPESFYTERCLESHLGTVHQGQSIQCDECPHTFPNITYYKLHKNMYHPASNLSAASFPFRNAFQLAALGAMTGQASISLKDEKALMPAKKEAPEKVLDLSSPVKPLKISCPEQGITSVPTNNTRGPITSQFTSIDQLTNNHSSATPTPSVGDQSTHNENADATCRTFRRAASL